MAREIALHLRKDYALEAAAAEPYSLLHERLAPQKGIEYGVCVYGEDVIEVFFERTCRRVVCPVGPRHRIEEGVDAVTVHIHEGITYRIASASREHGVLENMKDAGVILRRSIYVIGEEAFTVISREEKYLKACSVVSEKVTRAVVIGTRRNIC